MDLPRLHQIRIDANGTDRPDQKGHRAMKRNLPMTLLEVRAVFVHKKQHECNYTTVVLQTRVV